MPHEAKLIKSIPINFTDAEDKLCGPSNVDGVYSVKAGYRLLVEKELSSNVGTSNVSHSKNTWKGLWKLRIPNRTKTLMWRANLDAFPTRVNLVKRKVLTDPIYEVCGIEQESTLHALWSCPKLNEVWAVHFSLLRSEARECSTFLEVFRMCMEKSHPTDMFTKLASQIWFKRNKLRLGEEVVDLKLLNSMTRTALQDFQHANITAPKPPPA